MVSKFYSVIISSNKVCKWIYEDNLFLLITTIDPSCSKYDEEIKNKYGFISVHKQKFDGVWLVTVQTHKDNYYVKWVTFNSFLRANEGITVLKPIYDYIFEKQKALSIKLHYGLKNGKIVNIEEITVAERGLKCDCTCPGCGMKLQAKIGSGKKQRHFSHNNANCNIAVAQQTALHILAKEIIKEEKNIKLPPIVIPFEETYLYKNDPKFLYQFNNRYLCDIPKEIQYKPATTIEFDNVTLEKKISTIIPDILAVKGNKLCLIEIAVHHFIDENKENKIKELQLPVLEVDISSLIGENIDRNVLRDVITTQIENKKWIYNPLWTKAIEWADNEYKIIIENIKDKIKKDEIIQEQKRIIAQKREMQKNEKRLVGENALKHAFIPSHYSTVIYNLRDDKAVVEFYNELGFSNISKALPFFLNIPITGEFIFNCDRRIWQMLVFYKFVFNRKRDEFDYIYISYNKIIEYIKKYQKYFSINWEFSYTTIIDNEKHNLLRDVILQYLLYLKNLGFIEYEFSAYGGDGSVEAPHTLTPPNERYAKKLKLAIENIEGASPQVNKQIAENMRQLY